MTAAAFDQKFEDGEDISGHVDWASGRRPNLQAKRVNVDFPNWMVSGLDQEASRLGITRQALIKIWIADRLKEA
ncbi:MAG: BrnA antitoxin family protein [Mesorhizobium sp.]|nr:BrnA antitoxin family protein [Mesorhizobium sp.]